MDADDSGFSDGVAASSGDPRLLLGLNAVLSTLFGWTIVGGLATLDITALSPINVATASIVIFTLTYMVAMT